MADPAAVAARHTHKRCPDCRRVLPASEFYRRPDGYLSAYCKPHQLERGRAWRHARRPSRQRPAPAKGADNHRLPAAPLLEAIKRHARRRREPLKTLLGPELDGVYDNAQASGTITLVVLERFCDEVLGWHPRMLYGDAYDHAALSTNGSRARQDKEADR